MESQNKNALLRSDAIATPAPTSAPEENLIG